MNQNQRRIEKHLHKAPYYDVESDYLDYMDTYYVHQSPRQTSNRVWYDKSSINDDPYYQLGLKLLEIGHIPTREELLSYARGEATPPVKIDPRMRDLSPKRVHRRSIHDLPKDPNVRAQFIDVLTRFLQIERDFSSSHLEPFLHHDWHVSFRSSRRVFSETTHSSERLIGISRNPKVVTMRSPVYVNTMVLLRRRNHPGKGVHHLVASGWDVSDRVPFLGCPQVATPDSRAIVTESSPLVAQLCTRLTGDHGVLDRLSSFFREILTLCPSWISRSSGSLRYVISQFSAG